MHIEVAMPVLPTQAWQCHSSVRTSPAFILWCVQNSVDWEYLQTISPFLSLAYRSGQTDLHRATPCCSRSSLPPKHLPHGGTGTESGLYSQPGSQEENRQDGPRLCFPVSLSRLKSDSSVPFLSQRKGCVTCKERPGVLC